MSFCICYLCRHRFRSCISGLFDRYVCVIMRPTWFLQLVDNLYSDFKAPGFVASNNTRIRASVLADLIHH